MRCLPALLVGVLLLVMLPRKMTEFRLAIYIMLFVLLRDAMTPLGMWRLGSAGGFWLRLSESPVMLIGVGAMAAGLVLLTNFFEPELARVLVWRRGSWLSVILIGFAGAIVIAAPMFAIYARVPIAQRGGHVSHSFWPALFAFCLLGNFYEESLFRGYFQGLVNKYRGPVRAALLSGIMFSFGHIFLATTVTNTGYAVLLFTLYEGVIAGIVRMKSGLWAATIAHGMGIFLISSGLF